MRQGDVLFEGSIAGYQPLGAFGQPVHQSYVQLRAALERKLGPRYANFFARPQTDERSQTIRWVAPIGGQATSWRDLSPAEQADRALDLQIMRAEFDRYRKELLAEATPQAAGRPSGGQAFAAVLEQALKTPNDAHLHFIGDQPVASFWGFSEAGRTPFEPLAAVPPPSLKAAPAGAVESEAATVAAGAPARRRWWWALLLLPLLLLLLLFLLWPRDMEVAGWKPPVTLQSMLHEDEAKTTFHTADGTLVYERNGRFYDAKGVLVDRSRVLDANGVALRDGTGTDGQGPAMGQPDAAGQAADEQKPGGQDQPQPDQDAKDQAGQQQPPKPEAGNGAGKDANAGQDPNAGKEQNPAGQQDAAGQDQAGADAAGKPLAIPGNAAAGSGQAPAGFLAGRWRSQSGLVDQDTGAKLNQTYQFDKDGQGRSVVRRSNGMECSAPATAVMQGGKLVVQEMGNLTCPDGQAFEKSTTTCTRDASGQTRCTGANAGGTGYEVKIDRAGP